MVEGAKTGDFKRKASFKTPPPKEFKREAQRSDKAAKDHKDHKKGKRLKCFNCNGYRHYARDCTKPKKVVFASLLKKGNFERREGFVAKVKVPTTSSSELVYLAYKLMDVNVSMLLDTRSNPQYLKPKLDVATVH